MCPANLLGVICALRLAQTGAPCGVREIAPAVCCPGSPGRAATAPHKSRPWFGARLLREASQADCAIKKRPKLHVHRGRFFFTTTTTCAISTLRVKMFLVSSDCAH